MASFARLKLPFYFALWCLLPGCQSDQRPDPNDLPLETHFRRFDRAFFTSDTTNFSSQLNELRRQFPPFFQNTAEPGFWRAQRLDSQQIALFFRTEKQFGDMAKENQQLDLAMKRYYVHFGLADTLAVYSYISNLDFNYPVLRAGDSLAFVALDLYLGPESPYYQGLPNYLQYRRAPRFMIRDLMAEILSSHLPEEKEETTLLQAMVRQGKLLYALEQVLPDIPPADLLHYRTEELAFARAEERSMWLYFVENELLFSPSEDLKRRFLYPAPYSKFRSPRDPETPGQIGLWFGYRIVSAYAAKNDLTLPQLMNDGPAQKILRKSGYKP